MQNVKLYKEDRTIKKNLTRQKPTNLINKTNKNPMDQLHQYDNEEETPEQEASTQQHEQGIDDQAKYEQIIANHENLYQSMKAMAGFIRMINLEINEFMSKVTDAPTPEQQQQYSKESFQILLGILESTQNFEDDLETEGLTAGLYELRMQDNGDEDDELSREEEQEQQLYDEEDIEEQEKIDEVQEEEEEC